MNHTQSYFSYWHLKKAVNFLRQGGVLAYPTETVWGLGCLPFYQNSVERIFAIKGRNANKGLILVASNIQQLNHWFLPLSKQELNQLSERTTVPTSYLIPASASAPHWLTGGKPNLAVRFSSHPWVKALCDEVGLLVSTSCNKSGYQAKTTRQACVAHFQQQVEWVTPGKALQIAPASRLIELKTGKILRG